MNLLFNLIVKAWGWMLVGAVVIGLGAFWAWQGRNETVPERAELTEVRGVVQNVAKTWKEKRGTERDVKYELDIVAAGGQITKLTVSGDTMTEEQAGRLHGAQIQALTRDGEATDVWELSANGQKVVDYAVTRDKRLMDLAWQASYGPYIAGGGLLLLLGGVFRFRRERQSA